MNGARLVLGAAMDDWVSDDEVQGDLQAELSLDPATAYVRMVAEVGDWIRRDVLMPGDLVDGFRAWPGPAHVRAVRFADQAASLTVLTVPGQICWFDTGPNAEAELQRYTA